MKYLICCKFGHTVLALQTTFDSKRFVQTALTCQASISNVERQGDSQRVINTALTCQASISNAKRQGDSQRVINTALTCQASISDAKRQGDSQRAVATDLVYWSNTTVHNSEPSKTCKKLAKPHQKALLNGNNETHLHLWVTSKHHDLIKNIEANEPVRILSIGNAKAKHFSSSNMSHVRRSRLARNKKVYSRILRVREPSRIPFKKMLNFMRKNKTRRLRIKLQIMKSIPKSSAWHNLLCTIFRKYMLRQQANTWQYWKAPCRAIIRRHSKFYKHVTLPSFDQKTRNDQFIFKTNKSHANTSKCNIERLNTSDSRSLFLCGVI